MGNSAKKSAAVLRGIAGSTASFSAAIFPQPYAQYMVKFAGSLALCSLHTENLVDMLQKQQELEAINYQPDKNKGLSDSQKTWAWLLSAGITCMLASAKKMKNIPRKEIFLASVSLSSVSSVFFTRSLIENKQKIILDKIKTENENLDVKSRISSSWYIALKYSSSLRGIIGTILTVSAFSPKLPLFLLRGMGLSMLSLNFLETSLECGLLEEEIKCLSSRKIRP